MNPQTDDSNSEPSFNRKHQYIRVHTKDGFSWRCTCGAVMRVSSRRYAFPWEGTAYKGWQAHRRREYSKLTRN